MENYSTFKNGPGANRSIHIVALWATELMENGTARVATQLGVTIPTQPYANKIYKLDVQWNLT